MVRVNVKNWNVYSGYTFSILFLLLNFSRYGSAETLQSEFTLMPQKGIEYILLQGPSCDKKVSLDKPGDVVTGKVYFEYKITVKKADKYIVWSAGYPTDAEWISPFSWAVDDSPYQLVKKKYDKPYNDLLYGWTRLGECYLNEGEHLLKIQADTPRQSDNLVICTNEYYLLINDENYVPFAPDKLTQETDIWIEGEDFAERSSPLFQISKDPLAFGCAGMNIFTPEKPESGHYRLTYEFNIPSAGDYYLWILTYPSDYEWSFDNEDFKLFDERPFTNRRLNPESIWYNVGSKTLEQGKHTLKIQAADPKQAGGYYLLSPDAILISRNAKPECYGLIPLDASSKAKYQIAFEQIKKGNVFYPDENVTVGINIAKRLENVQSSGNFLMNYVVRDWQGKETGKGEEKIKVPEGNLITSLGLNLKNSGNGLYSLECSLQEGGKTIALNQTSLAVIPKEDKNKFDADSIFGAALNYWQLDDPSLSLIQMVGVKTIRTVFQWRDIQPAKDKWDWEKYDKLVAEAKKYNFNLMPFFYTTPDWASSAPETVKDDTRNYYPPANYEDWQKFVSATVNRYKESVKMWEIWNEPWPGGYAWHSTTESYRELLKSASEAAKKADPACKIAAYNWPHELYNSGYGPYFDANVIHPYNDEQPLPEQAFLTWCKDNVPLSKQYDQETWITEHAWGWIADSVIANYAVRAYTIALVYDVKKYCWFDFNHTSGVSGPVRGWGLMKRDLTPKIGFVAYNTLTSMLGKKRFFKTLDLKPDVWCCLFKEENQKKGVAVVWSIAKEKVSITFDSNRGEVYNLMYQLLPRINPQLYLNYSPVSLSESPVFIKTNDIEKLSETIKLIE